MTIQGHPSAGGAPRARARIEHHGVRGVREGPDHPVPVGGPLVLHQLPKLRGTRAPPKFP
jgi:hypothetical protein